jgi:hypothetical protein
MMLFQTFFMNCSGRRERYAYRHDLPRCIHSRRGRPRSMLPKASRSGGSQCSGTICCALFRSVFFFSPRRVAARIAHLSCGKLSTLARFGTHRRSRRTTDQYLFRILKSTPPCSTYSPISTLVMHSMEVWIGRVIRSPNARGNLVQMLYLRPAFGINLPDLGGIRLRRVAKLRHSSRQQSSISERCRVSTVEVTTLHVNGMRLSSH